MSTLHSASKKELPNAQKAALLLIALDPPYALQLMKSLSSEEIERISYWLNQFQEAPPELIKTATKEFYLFLDPSASQDETPKGNPPKAAGKEEPSEEEILTILRTADTKQLANFLNEEPASTLVLLFKSLNFARVQEILSALPSEKQEEIRALQKEKEEASEILTPYQLNEPIHSRDS